MRVVLITGISGSGKSIAIRTLEDDGYYCIDNLPAPFVAEVITRLESEGHARLAISVDARSARVSTLQEVIGSLRQSGHEVTLLFLNATTETLIHRFSETRRRHPLSNAPGANLGLPEAIELERETMAGLQTAGFTIDTTGLHPNVMRQWVRDAVGAEQAPITVMFESFSYKHGVPLTADLVFDVRCLPNPYYEPALRPLTGLDEPVQAFLQRQADVAQMIRDISGFVQSWLPAYRRENRSYLTVAVGCTGGQHRSVYTVQALADRFGDDVRVLVRHRAIASREPLAH
jgi:RNase adapter protein RapZ